MSHEAFDPKADPLKKMRDENRQLKRVDEMLTTEINRRVDIENVLIKMSKGELPLPTEKDCLMMALRLGTPKKEWSETVKNHIWGIE